MKFSKIVKKRIYAFYIDLIVIALLTSLIHAKISTSLFSVLASNGNEWLTPKSYIIDEFKGILTLVNYFFYFFAFYGLNKGQTIGKIIFGLKKIDYKNRHLSFISSFKCSIFYLLGYVTLFIPFLLYIRSKEGRHIIDRLSGTKVVDSRFFEEKEITLLNPVSILEITEKEAA